MKLSSLFAAVLLVSVFSAESPARGVYRDIYDLSCFISAPRERAITGSLLRSERSDHDASGVLFATDYPLKSRILVRAEMSYISLSTAGGIESGFGDFMLRARVRLIDRAGMHLFALGAVRTGSGSNAIFPYSSGSLDVHAGVGFIDSLAQFTVWGEVTGVRVSNKPDGLSEEEDHGDYAGVSAGLVLPLSGRLAFHFGASGYIFQSEGSREIYYTACDYAHSRALGIFLSLQAEGGRSDERAFDLGLRSGIRVRY